MFSEDDIDRMDDALAADYAKADADKDETRKAEIRAKFEKLEILRLWLMNIEDAQFIGEMRDQIGEIEKIIRGLGDQRALLGLHSLAEKHGIALPDSGDTVSPGPGATRAELPSAPPDPSMNTPAPPPGGDAGAFTSARQVAPKTIQYVDAQGHDVIREGGSRAWRNNNPGNIRKGSFANSAGAIGDDGAFAIFPDDKTGLRAVVTLLRSAAYSNLSLVDAVFKYAPPNENNSASYAKFLETETGIARNTVLSSLKVADIQKIAKAIQKVEGWIEGSERRNEPAAGSSVALASGLSSAASAATDWMDIARREAALPARERSEWADPGENPRILNYFKVAAPWFDAVGGDEVDWCAAFVNYCLVTGGYVGTDHPGARSFYWNKKKQFVKLDHPAFGAVAVRRYAPFGDPAWPSGPGHVGFVNSWTASTVTLLGGNQSKTIQLATYPLVSTNAAGQETARFVAFMMPVMN